MHLGKGRLRSADLRFLINYASTRPWSGRPVQNFRQRRLRHGPCIRGAKMRLSTLGESKNTLRANCVAAAAQHAKKSVFRTDAVPLVFHGVFQPDLLHGLLLCSFAIRNPLICIASASRTMDKHTTTKPASRFSIIWYTAPCPTTSSAHA